MSTKPKDRKKPGIKAIGPKKGSRKPGPTKTAAHFNITALSVKTKIMPLLTPP